MGGFIIYPPKRYSKCVEIGINNCCNANLQQLFYRFLGEYVLYLNELRRCFAMKTIKELELGFSDAQNYAQRQNKTMFE